MAQLLQTDKAFDAQTIFLCINSSWNTTEVVDKVGNSCSRQSCRVVISL